MLPENKNQNGSSSASSCGCSLCGATTSKKSTERYSGDTSIAERIRNLPKIKAGPGFDQKMAAAFALELDQEIRQKNSAWLRKNSKILLPDLISNNGRERL